MDIQNLEDALMSGRKFSITVDFVSDDDGTPVVDLRCVEGGLYKDSSIVFIQVIGGISLEDAFDRLNEKIKRYLK